MGIARTKRSQLMTAAETEIEEFYPSSVLESIMMNMLLGAPKCTERIDMIYSINASIGLLNQLLALKALKTLANSTSTVFLC